MKTKIILDSTSDIPKNWLEKYDIDIVSLHVNWPNDESEPDDTRDEEELKEFYEKLSNAEQLPKTSQPSIVQFQEAYKKAIDNGYDSILVLTISTKMSGTYNSALLASQEFEIPIKVIDTKMASSVIANMARYARELLESGMDLDDVVEQLQIARENKKFHAIFFVSDFDFLVKGGRVSRFSGFVGNLLKIKVGIFINKDGEMIPFDKVRGYKKAYNMILTKMEEEGVKIGKKIGLIGIHCNAKEHVEEMLKLIRERYKLEYFEMSNTGKVISTHVGIGMAGFGIEILE
ncbi:carbohydrate-binding protein [Thermosipho melanesiensis]|uniref:DegV family protein n=2 Tax=Thermosipho melanesiensis TaxID=46541 RepID=A6LJ01_THEM4|nr:DegV family protein [Thermosipho melanesiensis]ABR29902.1 degV family protein [Thermosipho melanesiensis BI429]APT73110.1 carbohydrate-binding protein [Thermosipho melanesiensis]OOC38509.1 carbohydrate-binding protein [Thermosipho melanesiensis]OOC40313.1 carbohydrate-binding protein [Thermosipho melanesiensis]OOC40577.1 carbohydrate-binding protein [Thermosipho melanesiensis]